MNRNRQLRVAMLGHKRIPSREGGIEVVVGELSTRLVKYGCSITCYNRRGQHISGKEYTQKVKKYYKGVRLKYVFTIDYRGWAAMTSSVFAAIRATFGKYDVVHFHAEGPCAMLWLPKLFGKKCIVTIHGLDHKRKKWGKFSSAYIMLGEKVAVKYADEIIVLTESIKKYFLDTYNRKTQVIPNGVNKPAIRKADEIKEKFKLEKDSYILFVGRLTPEKGLEYLIQAYKKLDVEKKLVIAGGTSDTEQYVIKLKNMSLCNSNIIFTGFVEGTVLEELYSNAYIFVQPSDLEGMPLGLMEAMSYGNCCLVSDIPECLEVIEKNGMSFKKGNIEDLEYKLNKLCNSKGLVEKFKESSSEYICSKYSWDDVAKKTLKLYQKISHS